MTERDIALIIGKDRVLAGHPVVCANVNSFLKGQQDVLSMNKKGFLIEYEIKISRGDFKRDARKGREFSFTDPIALQDEWHLERIPNQFYYVIPVGLVDLSEIPSWAGYFQVIDGNLVLAKKAPMIHNNKADKVKLLAKITTLYQQRTFLGCCLLTYNNKKNREANKNILEQHLPKKCLSKVKRGKNDPCPFPCNSCKLCISDR